MNGKLSNIGKWVLGLLALITVVLAVWYYLGISGIVPKFSLERPKEIIVDQRALGFLIWGFVLLGLGILVALFSVCFTAGVKGVNGKTLLFAVIAFIVIAAIAFLMSNGVLGWARECMDCKALSFFDPNTTYPEDMKEGYSRLTFYFVEYGINFFVVTFIGALLSILFSVIYKSVKK
jgi:hypothetical protein